MASTLLVLAWFVTIGGAVTDGVSWAVASRRTSTFVIWHFGLMQYSGLISLVLLSGTFSWTAARLGRDFAVSLRLPRFTLLALATVLYGLAGFIPYFDINRGRGDLTLCLASTSLVILLSMLTVRAFAEAKRAADPLDCVACGYSLRGSTSPTCPECGHRLSPAELTARVGLHPSLE